MSESSALAGRIRGYLAELDKVVDRTNTLVKKAEATGDDGYWDGVALNLHSFYSGIERIFEDIARTMDGTLSSGPDWHTSLLVQMTAESTGRRPAAISLETRFMLDEYRGFRHVVRNVYAFNFRPSRLKELVDGLQNCYTTVKNELQTFVHFLETLDTSTKD